MSTPSPSPSGPPLDLTQRLNEQLAVERVREGDALALEMIFTAYRGELFAIAFRIVGVREVAEEALQDVFLAIWTGRARWHITTSLGAYLRRAVHNVATRSAMSRTRGASSDVELDEAEFAVPAQLADRGPTPEAEVERAELRAALEDATRALPPRAREVFTLKRQQFLSNREIATRLGLSVKTVEIHMTRALAALRRHLRDWRG